MAALPEETGETGEETRNGSIRFFLREHIVRPGECAFETLENALDAAQGLVPLKYLAGPKWDAICKHGSEPIETHVMIMNGGKGEAGPARVLLAKFLIKEVCGILKTELSTRQTELSTKQRLMKEKSLADQIKLDIEAIKAELDDIALAIDRVVDFVIHKLNIPVRRGEDGSLLFSNL